MLLRWGLLYGWRIRFCGPQDTIAVGLGGTGSVNALQVSGRRRNAVTTLGRPTPPIDLPSSVMPEGAARVAVHAGPPTRTRLRPGAPTDAPAGQGSTTFIEDAPAVRVTVTVESWGDWTLAVATDAAITAERLDAVNIADRTGRRLQRTAMAGMVVTLLAGAVSLLVAREAPPLLWPVVLGLVAFASVMIGEPQMFPRMVVFEFDGKEPLAQFRRRHVRQTMVAATVNGVFVTAGLVVGLGLLRAAAAPAPPSVPIQVAIGSVVACVGSG